MSMDFPIVMAEHRTPCVDLRATFAEQFRFIWDEAYEAERPEFRKREAPWLTRIPGKFGWIFPWGGRLLAVYTNKRKVQRILLGFPEITVRQGGGDCPEVIASFDVTHIHTIAEVIQAKRRRYSTPEQRTAASVHLRKFQFTRKTRPPDS